MSLTEHERRALRAIDEALSADDPELAALLRGPSSASTARVVRKMALASAGVAAVLLLLGLVLLDPGLWVGGLVVMLVIPPTLWGVAAAIAHEE